MFRPEIALKRFGTDPDSLGLKMKELEPKSFMRDDYVSTGYQLETVWNRPRLSRIENEGVRAEIIHA